MYNNTSIQKKNTFCALQTLNKMNNMETTQHKLLHKATIQTNDIQVVHLHILFQSHSHPLLLEAFIFFFQATQFHKINIWYLWLTYEWKSNLKKNVFTVFHLDASVACYDEPVTRCLVHNTGFTWELSWHYLFHYVVNVVITLFSWVTGKSVSISCTLCVLASMPGVRFAASFGKEHFLKLIFYYICRV